MYSIREYNVLIILKKLMKITIFVDERKILFWTALVITLECLNYDGQLSELNK